ncbi:MAG: cytochrome P450, partial [Candidatus Binatia bacterium]
AFTPRRVASLEAHIREVVQRLIEPLAAQGEFDLVRDLAIPLPVMAIAELLGVPPERYPDFKRWVNSLLGAATASSQEDRDRILQCIAEWRAYFQAAIAAYHEKPGDNLLSDMVRAEEENQVLTDEEILSQAIIILIGGVETTTNLIANAILALFDHPDQFAKVRANLGLVPNLVEETLRYEPPVVGLMRQATQEITLSGTTLPAGAIVLFLLASANHDERKFPDPERFDILRNAEGHLGFGYGIHFCLGAQLARLEAKVTLETLLRQFPRLARTDAPITRVQSPFVRGPQTLPLVGG